MDKNNIEVKSFDLDFRAPDLKDIEMFILKHPDVDAIFCSSDVIAMYTMSVLSKLGYSIPNDVQVIGFDNIEFCKVLIPSLTSVAQPILEIGKVAMDKIFKMIDKKKLLDMHSIVPVELIERNSTK